jgi:Ca-activated chloride channel homolog
MSDAERASRARRRRAMRHAKWVVPLLAFAFVWAGYSHYHDPNPPKPGPGQTLHILTGTENRILFDDPNSDEPTILEQFAEEHNVTLVPTFQGSVDTMIDLQGGAAEYDAVWPASSIWLNLGDTNGVTSRTQSIMSTPVVFGVKRSTAEALGWIGRDVSVDEILAAAESGQLDFLMSSASQSNSGAMAYLGFLSAFAGHPDVLTSQMLQDPNVADQVTRILGEVDRTAGASGLLRDLLVENYDDYDGMVNNESAVITANQRLKAKGVTDLLYVIYPVDGLAIADWPLAFVDHQVEGRSELFDAMQEYLLSDDVQHELLSQGRRTSKLGQTINPALVDPDVFNPDWGIDIARPLNTFTLPAANVILEALNLYQSTFRKPSLIVFCLDYSGSMEGGGEQQLEEAMATLLDSAQASKLFLQRTSGDITIVLPFSDGLKKTLKVDGDSGPELLGLLDQVQQTDASGGTNIYGCLQDAQAYFTGPL